MTTRFTLLLLVAVAFVLGLTLGPWIASRSGAQGAVGGRSTGGLRDSVAVLPFDAPRELHDGVKYHLARWVKEIPVHLLDDSSLRVARPRSVLNLGAINDPIMAGQRLGVATVLTGKVTIEDEGARMLIEAELLEVDTGLLLWTRTWEVEDIFKKNETLLRICDEMGEGVKKRLERECSQRQPRK